MNKVICDHTGAALYCKKDCIHGKSHVPKVFENITDCRDKSKCSIVEKTCQCTEKEMEIIE